VRKDLGFEEVPGRLTKHLVLRLEYRALHHHPG
jgi:hypothetical protein